MHLSLPEKFASNIIVKTEFNSLPIGLFTTKSEIGFNKKETYHQDNFIKNVENCQIDNWKSSKQLLNERNKEAGHETIIIKKKECNVDKKENGTSRDNKEQELLDKEKKHQDQKKSSSYDPESTFVKGYCGGDQNEEPPSLHHNNRDGIISKIEKDLKETEKNDVCRELICVSSSTEASDFAEKETQELSEKEKRTEKETHGEKEGCDKEEFEDTDGENFSISDPSEFLDLGKKGEILFDDIPCPFIPTDINHCLEDEWDIFKDDLLKFQQLVKELSKNGDMLLMESSSYKNCVERIEEDIQIINMELLQQSFKPDEDVPWLPKWKHRKGKGIPPLYYRVRCYMNSGGATGGGGNSSSNNSSQNDGYSGRNNDSGGSNQNRSNNRRRSGGEEDDGDDDRERNPRRNSSDISNIPSSDYKAPKKKHSSIPADEIFEVIGKLGMPDITVQTAPNIIEFKKCMECLITCMSGFDFESETDSCLLCSILDGLLKHLAKCSETLLNCRECKQIIMLVLGHVKNCIQLHSSDPLVNCEARLCRRIQKAISYNVSVLQDNTKHVIIKLKKYLQDTMLQITMELDVNLDSIRSLDSLKTSDIQLFEEENQQTTSTSRKPSITKSVEPPSHNTESASGHTKLIRKSSGRKSVTLPSIQEQPEISTSEIVYDSKLSLLQETNKSLRTEILIENELTSQIGNTQYEETGAFGSDYSITNKVYGDKRPFTSLPADRVVGGYGMRYDGPLFSFEDRPTGEPGIGEVVYGNRNQLLKVANHWTMVKDEYKKGVNIRQQNREEGVILSDAQDDIQICKTRYQPHVQWQKLVHLGNGMSGKCYLASDRNTDFQFCVKVIHISHFESGELSVWSELNHINIPRLYGALRVGEDIYLFNEFIDGGCLTEHINQQKECRRRLSQKTVLIYGKQLLNVLVYLKNKRIVHEDIKCDNILLVRGTTQLKLCDFGLARHVHGDKDFKKSAPIGTQTQWSPEKAASQGYSYPADLWALICAVIHMLSGYPPWIKRYPNYRALHIIIHDNSPPLQDIPKNLLPDVRHLIEEGLTVDQDKRPTAMSLLRHPAFNLIEPGVTDVYYSTLPLSQGSSMGSSGQDTSLERQNRNPPSFGRLSPSAHHSDHKNSVSRSDEGRNSLNSHKDDLSEKMTKINLNPQTLAPPSDKTLKQKLGITEITSDQLEQIVASVQTPKIDYEVGDDTTDTGGEQLFRLNLPNFLDEVSYRSPTETIENSANTSSASNTDAMFPENDADTFKSEELFSPIAGITEPPDNETPESENVRMPSDNSKASHSPHKNSNLHLYINPSTPLQFTLGNNNNSPSTPNRRKIVQSTSDSSGIGLTPVSSKSTPNSARVPRFERNESGYEPGTPSSTKSNSGKSHQEQADEELKALMGDEFGELEDQDQEMGLSEAVNDAIVEQELEKLQSMIPPGTPGSRITFTDKNSLNRSISFCMSNSVRDWSEIFEQIASKIHDEWGYARFIVTDDQGNYITPSMSVGDGDVGLFVQKVEDENTPWFIENSIIQNNFIL